MLWRFRRELACVAGILLCLLILNRGLFRMPVRLPRPGRAARASGYEELARENRRLRELLALRAKSEFSRTVAGEVVSVKPFVCPSEMVVNKGRRDGVEKDMVVVSNRDCLVGRVVEVSDDSSRVFTVFHPMSKVSVVVAPTREIGILEGGTFPFLYVRFLPGDTKAGAGTEMVTSGLSDFYPRGIRVGTIARMGRMKSDFFLQAWVKPAAGFSSLDEVLIGR